MFWPNGKHRFGWFCEPAYDYSFAGDHQQSIGISAASSLAFRDLHRPYKCRALQIRERLNLLTL
jgi:hypothetical protein